MDSKQPVTAQLTWLRVAGASGSCRAGAVSHSPSWHAPHSLEPSPHSAALFCRHRGCLHGRSSVGGADGGAGGAHGGPLCCRHV